MGRLVVYNACYGGYSLSEEAVMLMNERGYNYDEYDMCYEVPRHNKDLVEVVQILGDRANGECAKLELHELSENGRAYKIREYDGLETVEEPHNIDYVIIDD